MTVAADQATGAAVESPGERERLAGAPLRIAVYRSLAELPEAARAFLAAQASEQLCLSESWFDVLLRHGVEPGLALRIYAVSAGERIRCLLFAASAPSRTPWSGRRLLSLTSFYTMIYAPVVAPEDAGAALDALAAAIRDERPRWDAVELRSLIAEAATTDALIGALRGAGFLVATYDQFENWYQPTRGISGKEYFATRPSQLRNTVARKGRKAQKEHRFELRIHVAPAELPQAIADYQRIYARSWKEPEQFPEFVPELLRRAAAAGTLRLGVLYLDGEPAAAQIWLLAGSRTTIYKLAYDERFAKLSVGSILTKAMFDYALDVDRVSEVDYGVGSEPYKRDWMGAHRRIVGLLAFNPRSARGLLAAARHFAGPWLRGPRRRGTRMPERKAT